MLKKKNRTIADITKGYEKFINGKELNSNGSKLFNKVIKNAAKPKVKQRAAK